MGEWNKNAKTEFQLVIDPNQNEYYFGATTGKKYAKHGIGCLFKDGLEPGERVFEYDEIDHSKNVSYQVLKQEASKFFRQCEQFEAQVLDSGISILFEWRDQLQSVLSLYSDKIQSDEFPQQAGCSAPIQEDIKIEEGIGGLQIESPKKSPLKRTNYHDDFQMLVKKQQSINESPIKTSGDSGVIFHEEISSRLFSQHINGSPGSALQIEDSQLRFTGSNPTNTKYAVKFVRYPQVLGDFSKIPEKYRNSEDYKKRDKSAAKKGSRSTSRRNQLENKRNTEHGSRSTSIKKDKNVKSKLEFLPLQLQVIKRQCQG